MQKSLINFCLGTTFANLLLTNSKSSKSVGFFDVIKTSKGATMKRFSKTLAFLNIFIFVWGNLAGANSLVKTTAVKGKLGSLNSLKKIHSNLLSNGHIVR